MKVLPPSCADHGGGVGADHDQLAVGHVDDAGDAEDDRQTQSCDHQDRDDAEAAEELGDDRLQHSAPAPKGSPLSRRPRLRGRLLAPPAKGRCPPVTSQSFPERFFSCDSRASSRDRAPRLIGEVAVLVRIEVGRPTDRGRIQSSDFHTTSNWPCSFALPMRAHSQVWWFFSSILTLPCGAWNSCPGSPSKIRASASVDLHLLDRLGEEVGLEVGGLHHRVGHRVLAVFGLVALDERLVLRGVDALEVVERGVVADARSPPPSPRSPARW